MFDYFHQRFVGKRPPREIISTVTINGDDKAVNVSAILIDSLEEQIAAITDKMQEARQTAVEADARALRYLELARGLSGEKIAAEQQARDFAQQRAALVTHLEAVRAGR